MINTENKLDMSLGTMAALLVLPIVTYTLIKRRFV